MTGIAITGVSMDDIYEQLCDHVGRAMFMIDKEGKKHPEVILTKVLSFSHDTIYFQYGFEGSLDAPWDYSYCPFEQTRSGSTLYLCVEEDKIQEVQVKCDSLEELEKFIKDHINCTFFTSGGDNEKYCIRFHEVELSSNRKTVDVVYSDFGSDNRHPASYSENHLRDLDLTMQVMKSKVETFEEKMQRKQKEMFMKKCY